MKKENIAWIIIGVLAVGMVFALFGKVQNAPVGQAVAEKLDTAGWTENEIMNYEMHGTVPARAGSSSGGMVGGC